MLECITILNNKIYKSRNILLWSSQCHLGFSNYYKQKKNKQTLFATSSVF